MERPFICGVRLTPDTFHSSFFCGTSRFSVLSCLLCCHLSTHFHGCISNSSLCFTTYSHMLSPLLSVIVASLEWEQIQKSKMPMDAFTYRVVDKDTNLPDQEIWRVGPGGRWGLRWLKAFIRGSTGWDSSWTLNFMYFWGNNTEDLWRQYWLVPLCSAGLCSCPPHPLPNALWQFLFCVLLYCFDALVSWLSWPTFQVVPSL